MVCEVNISETNKLNINTYKLVYSARLDDLVRHPTEESIPDLLHRCTTNLDVVLEWIVLPSYMHHERWDENATPDLAIDLAWKIVILEFLVCRSGFFFGHKCLIDVSYYVLQERGAYLAVQASLAFDGRRIGRIAFEASSFLMIRETPIVCIDRIWILFDFDGVLSASDGDSTRKNGACSMGGSTC